MLQVLRYTAGHINYGGRVTDDIDRRCMMGILGEFYTPEILEDEHHYSESGIYRQISPALDHHVIITLLSLCITILQLFASGLNVPLHVLVKLNLWNFS